MRPNQVIIFSAILLAVAGFAYYLSLDNTNFDKNNSAGSSSRYQDEILTPEQIITPETSGPESKSYADSQGIYTIKHPSDYTLEEDGGFLRIYKRAETARPQGEISDGLLIVIESINLNGQTLEELVESRINQAKADGSLELVQNKRATVLNGYPGFSYELKGYGGSQYLLIQKSLESDFALSITFLLNDPQQRGYQAELNSILSSLQLSK